jgi:hypothetical protein
MTDAVQVFPPGYRVTDSNGDPVNNAKIKFREIGPGATKLVYSDAALSVSLGHTVRTRSDGFPVVSQGSSTTCLIYVGADPYYIEITDENDVAIFPAKDNVKGAVDTSDFLTDADTSILTIPVLSKTGNYPVVAADKGKLIAANAGGGFFTLTLPSAITVGDGWNIGIRNDGTSNQVGITASQNIATSMGAVTSFSLRPGETVWLESNGATFKVSGYTPPLISGNVGVILIADRLSDPPVSPTAGARYLVGSTPLNAWSTFAQHDIAEANGQGGWFKITPPADCGWLAFVQDEDAYYAFKDSAWAGAGKVAVQVFTASGTYTPTPSLSYALVISTGGGGGGGGADSDGSSNAAGAGGSAGGTCIELFTAATIGASQAVTIGAGGTAGAATGTNGGAGGDTTFGALHTAGGGPGGTGIAGTDAQNLVAGPAAGAATGGLINIPGAPGGAGYGDANGIRSGHGGASFWGGGATATLVASSTATAGTNGPAYGAGASGAGNANTAAGAAGGIGADGICVVIEFA